MASREFGFGQEDVRLAGQAIRFGWPPPRPEVAERYARRVDRLATGQDTPPDLMLLAVKVRDGMARTSLKAIETEAKVRAMETVDGPLTVRDMFAKLDDGLAAHEAKRALEATPEFQARQATQQAERNGVPRPRVPRLVRPDPRTS